MYSDESKSTKIGNAVVSLQSTFPLARIVYASATAAWQPHHLTYLQRLNLWGNETYSDASSFVNSFSGRYNSCELTKMNNVKV